MRGWRAAKAGWGGSSGGGSGGIATPCSLADGQLCAHRHLSSAASSLRNQTRAASNGWKRASDVHPRRSLNIPTHPSWGHDGRWGAVRRPPRPPFQAMVPDSDVSGCHSPPCAVISPTDSPSRPPRLPHRGGWWEVRPLAPEASSGVSHTTGATPVPLPVWIHPSPAPSSPAKRPSAGRRTPLFVSGGKLWLAALPTT